MDLGDGWRKANASGKYGNCVAVRPDGTGAVELMDTKVGPEVSFFFSKDEWSAFLNGAKKGEFDDLI